MAKQTWYARILAYMVACGYTEVATRSVKYRRFTTTVPGERYRSYLLGKNGNVRRELTNQDTGQVVHTMSVTELFKKYTVAWEQRTAFDAERKARIAQ